MYRRIPFQKLRIMLFAMKHAAKQGFAEDGSNQEAAHKQLVELAVVAVKSIETGQPEVFFKLLDDLKTLRNNESTRIVE